MSCKAAKHLGGGYFPMLLLLLLNPGGWGKPQRNLIVKTNQKVLAAQQRSLVDHKQPSTVHQKHGKMQNTHFCCDLVHSVLADELRVWWGDLMSGAVTWCTILLNASCSLPWMVASFLASLLASWIGMSTLYTSFTASYMPAWRGHRGKPTNAKAVASNLPQRCWISSTTRSHHREGSSRLLQESHKANFSEVFPWAYALLVWWHHIIRDGGFLQHVGGNMLRTHRQYKWVQAPSCSYARALLSSPGRWRSPRADTCGPRACSGTLRPERRCEPDTEPPQRGCSSPSVFQPCSGAMSGAGQVTSGNPWQSYRRKNRRGLWRRSKFRSELKVFDQICMAFVPVHQIY